MIDFLNKYALRSYIQVTIHFVIAIAIAIILAFVFCRSIIINASAFVAISSSLSAVSGVLLAIYLALFFYFARNFLDRRSGGIDSLRILSGKLRAQMEKSAKIYPDISRRLSALYDKSLKYIPGEPVNMEDIEATSSIFTQWASEQARIHQKKLDAGDPKVYESFEIHLRDAYTIQMEVVRAFRMLHVVYIWSTTIPTFIPLMLTWAIIVLMSLVFSIIGGIGIIPAHLGIPILMVPIYLLFIAIFALLKDVSATIWMTRDLETAYEKAMDKLPTTMTFGDEHPDTSQ